jgi:biotin carboxylase
MHACYTADEFKEYYAEAITWSKKKKVIIEELITNAREVFFQYNIQDGKTALSSCFTKVFTETENKELILPIFHMYPSKFIEEYYETVHHAVIQLFRDLDIRNGYMTLQSFYKDGQFYVFEAGYRMGGAQNYIFTDYQNGVNALEGMINYALTGHMSDDCMVDRDNARFKYPCCNYYVGLKPGTIERMDGVEEVRKMPGVLNVTVMSHVGQVVEDTNALERVCLRIHVLGETKDALAKLLVRISQTLRIISTEGEEMQLEHLSYDRCINAINESVRVQA